MAIKIITPGKFESKYTGQCQSCGCVIECLKQDMFYPDQVRSDQTHPEGFIQCPTMGCMRHIVPSPVQK